MKEMVEGGRKLLDRVRADGLTVAAACWAKRADDSQWYLFLVSPGVERTGVRPGYVIVRTALESLESAWADDFERVDLSDVRILGTTDPLADSVLAFNRHDLGLRHIGIATDAEIVPAYIYPPALPTAPAARPAAGPLTSPSP